MAAKYFDNVFDNYADDTNSIENKNSEECSLVPAGVFRLTVMEQLQGVITKKLRELELPLFVRGTIFGPVLFTYKMPFIYFERYWSYAAYKILLPYVTR